MESLGSSTAGTIIPSLWMTALLIPGILRIMLAQGLGSFVVWILYGVFQARRSAVIRESVSAMPRSKRALYGAALMLGGIVLLFAGFFGILSMGGFGKSGMTAVAWLLVTILGVGFVHCQTMGMAMLVSLGLENVTTHQAAASTSAESVRKP